MALIKSISGIRGTISGATDSLNPLAIARFTSAYATLVRRRAISSSNNIVVGRDARLSGNMVRDVVCGTLVAMGFDVLDLGLASTPTTELAVVLSHSAGGIIITASHNPRHWNALKLLNEKGEFLSHIEGSEVLEIAEKGQFPYVDVDHIGKCREDGSFDRKHVEKVLSLPLVNVEAIREAHFNVAVDTINSVGAIVLPRLFNALGVKYTLINGSATGDFAHDPEPLEQNLGEIMATVKKGGFDLGIVVDPDVDRLCFINEDGTPFGEEYTLVSVADYVLSKTPGNTVSNLSSTRALKDVTERHGGEYFAAAVGEVNVTTKMKEVGAIIGGEGNGGVVYPQCHYGRDALVGIALFLSSLAEKKIKASCLRASFPNYYMAKNKVVLPQNANFGDLLSQVESKYKNETITTIDGIKIDFPDKWVHLRRSNTEPIVRVYSEAKTKEEAESLANEIINLINSGEK